MVFDCYCSVDGVSNDTLLKTGECSNEYFCVLCYGSSLDHIAPCTRRCIFYSRQKKSDQQLLTPGIIIIDPSLIRYLWVQHRGSVEYNISVIYENCIISFKCSYAADWTKVIQWYLRRCHHLQSQQVCRVKFHKILRIR